MKNGSLLPFRKPLLILLSAGVVLGVIATEQLLQDRYCDNLTKAYCESYLLHAELGNVPRPAASPNALRGFRRHVTSPPYGLVVQTPSGDVLRYHVIKRTTTDPRQPNLRYDFRFTSGLDANGNRITNAPLASVSIP